MTLLLSRAAYAKTHGVSKQSAAKWESKGLLVFRDGKVFVPDSDRRLQHAGLGRFRDAGGAPPKPTTGQPGPSTAEPIVGQPEPARSPLQELAEAADNPLADPEQLLTDFLVRFDKGELSSIFEAETVKANALAAKRLVEARIAAGAVVDLEAAEHAFFAAAREWRDAWMNFPTRVGPLLAAELGVETGRVVEALTAHVHQQIVDLGEPEPGLKPDEG